MKKPFIKSNTIIILFLFSFFFFPKSYSFLGEDSGLNLYENIDKGIYELELKLIEAEITDKKVNEDLKKLGENCSLKGITQEDIEKISNGNIKIIKEKIDEKCKNNGAISIKTITSIKSKITTLNNIYKKNIEEKASSIYSIARIGLYSDGIKENSGFDLIDDIQEIDKIIFEEDIEYNGENTYIQGDKTLNDFLKGKEEKAPFISPLPGKNSKENKKAKPNIKNLSDISNYSGANTYVCVNQNDSSGLNKEALDQILSGNKAVKDGNERKEDENIGSFKKVDKKGGFYKKSRTGYKKVNDNSIWPCDSFFCIIIDFVTYNHKLLGGGKSFTVESVVNRSNKHLKKFSNTSLTQSKMTTNFFELGLRDLNLAEIFHIGFQISKKSPPLLNLQQDKKDEGPLASKNMLREYYKNLGLDYDRANSLVKYRHKEEELKTLIDSAELSITTVIQKYARLQEQYDDTLKKNDLISKQVDKIILYEDMNTFYKQFVELEKFTGNLSDYTVTINQIIKEFNKTPVHK